MHPTFLILLETAAVCLASTVLVYSGNAGAWGTVLLCLAAILYHCSNLVDLLSPEDY